MISQEERVTKLELTLQDLLDKPIDAIRKKTRKCRSNDYISSISFFSCFQVTPKIFFNEAKVNYFSHYPIIIIMQALKDRGISYHYFPPFYGKFLGPYQTDGQALSSNDVANSSFQLIYLSQDTHRSLITLTFSADSISFVENRYQFKSLFNQLV